MDKHLRLFFVLAACTLINATSLYAQTFGPDQNNPFGLTIPDNYTKAEFADLDGDGDIDMLSGAEDGNFYYFENAGTPAAPSFNPVVMNPFSLTNIGAYSNPTFVDLDGDGDLDMMSGAASGDFIYFENTGSAVAPSFGTAQTTPFGLALIVSGSSAPAFADLDNDGDMDMLSGAGSGDVEYFQNTGSASVPSFTLSVTNPFGFTTIATGYFDPGIVDLDGDGDYDVMTGAGNGDFMYFENTGSMASPAFTPSAANPFSLTNAGVNTGATFADMDNDGDADLMTGEWTTGYHYFEQITCPLFPAPIDTTPAANLTICTGTSTTLYASGMGTLGWYDAATGGTWLGGGNSFATMALTDTATFYVQDSNACGESVRTAVTVNISIPMVYITGDDTICDGQNTLLTANGASTYVWAGGPSTQTYLVQPYTNDSSFVVTGTDSIGCSGSDTISIAVNLLPIVTILPDEDTVCANESTTLTALGAQTYSWVGGPSTQDYTVWPTVSTPYTVIGTDSNGCSGSATQTIETRPLPDVTVFAFGPGAATSNFTADSYLWVFCLTYFPALGTNDQQYYLGVIPTDYAVIITENGCTDTSDCITLEPIGIEENEAAEDVFNVYPNPASSQINIEATADFTSVQVTDVNGKLVVSEAYNRNSTAININALQNGLYFVRLMNGNTPLGGMQKLVVSR